MQNLWITTYCYSVSFICVCHAKHGNPHVCMFIERQYRIASYVQYTRNWLANANACLWMYPFGVSCVCVCVWSRGRARERKRKRSAIRRFVVRKPMPSIVNATQLRSSNRWNVIYVSHNKNSPVQCGASRYQINDTAIMFMLLLYMLYTLLPLLSLSDRRREEKKKPYNRSIHTARRG